VAAAARDLLIGVRRRNGTLHQKAIVPLMQKSVIPLQADRCDMRSSRAEKRWHKICPRKILSPPAAQWKIAGKPVPKVDDRAFVTGRQQYTPDLRPAGMPMAKSSAPPSLAAQRSFLVMTAPKSDGGLADRHAMAIFIGAAAPAEREAQKPLPPFTRNGKKVRRSRTRNSSRISGKGLQQFRSSPSQSGKFRGRRLASAAHRLDATYTIAISRHAPLEPRAAVAE